MADDEGSATPTVSGRFSALPPRVEPKDMVEEQPVESVPEATPDPNTEVARRWGMGIAPGG